MGSESVVASEEGSVPPSDGGGGDGGLIIAAIIGLSFCDYIILMAGWLMDFLFVQKQKIR